MMSLQSKREWIFPKKKIKDSVLNQYLESRDIKDAGKYLDISLGDIPSPSKLYNSKKAAKEILSSITLGEKIVIHGDYDADGICASALLWEFIYRDLANFLDRQIDIVPYIPSRIEQGYGLTEDSLKDILELKGRLVVSVDCGIRDEELIKKYQGKNLKFVITDHHHPPENLCKKLPYPLVHQLYPNHSYPAKEICGTAVVFLLIQEIKKLAGMKYGIDEDTKGLDLVALATVTDLMPLIDTNRVFVKYGLNQIRKEERKGLKYLSLRAGINPIDINSYHLGYVIGPRINAAGRIGAPMEAVKLLVSNDDKLCKEISENLEDLNFQRQRVTAETVEEAENQLGDLKNERAIFVLGSDWHEGVIGLVAGKLQEKYYRPTIVATVNEELVKGSARSIQGFNITDSLGKFTKYLERYGGHMLAAGFTAKKDSIDEFREKYLKFANKEISEEQLISKLKVDLLLESNDIDKLLIDELEKLEPFGFGNPKPVICLKDLVIVRKVVMGKEENHMKLLVKGSGVDLLTLLLFGAGEDKDILEVDSKIDVVGYPDINVWNGNENIQFNVREWRFSKK